MPTEFWGYVHSDRLRNLIKITVHVVPQKPTGPSWRTHNIILNKMEHAGETEALKESRQEEWENKL